MQHLTKAAAVQEITDLGEFEAIAAAWTVDRQKEQIRRGAFEQTIARWQASGKRLPLHWSHSARAEDIIGSIDPASMRETDEGLRVAGKLDLDESGVAREAWRSMRNDAVALSFGYMVQKSHRAGDLRVLDELDLFEVSIVAAPANADTRVISMKSAEAPTQEELIERARALGIELEPRTKAAPIRIATFEVG